MSFRKYLVLAGITVLAAAGDTMLSHGMKQAGRVSIHHLHGVILAILNPWVALGVLLLLGFFAAYMNALSWADLTYVLPATSLGYELLAFVARFALHEHVSTLRWLGIVLISSGVGFVAGGPALTSHGHRESPLVVTEVSDEVLASASGEEVVAADAEKEYVPVGSGGGER